MPDAALVERAGSRVELEPAARNIVRTCLAVKGEDRVVLVVDEATAELAAPVLAELRAAGAATKTFLLERLGARPLPTLPAPLASALADATVSVMMVRPEPGELEVRGAVVELAQRHGLRHAHMPGIDLEAMTTAMRADYGAVARLQDRLLARLEAARVVEIRAEGGTDLEVRLDSGHRWVRSDGIIRPGEPQNLPTGLLQTTPETAEGVYVADGAIGDWFGARHGGLAEHPLRVELYRGRVRDARCVRASLARQLLLYVRSNPNGDRVGELALGTNLALGSCVGNVLHDQNVPGALITLGGSATMKAVGARWSARTHVPLVARRCDVDVDGEAVMRAGHYVDDLLA
jgi:aminopeptidase